MKSKNSRHRPDDCTQQLEKLQSISSDSHQQEAMELLDDCEQSLVAHKANWKRFFRTVLRIRPLMKETDRFDKRFQQLVAHVAVKLEERNDSSRAFKWLDDARNKCGQLLAQSEARPRLYRLFRSRSLVREAASTLVSQPLEENKQLMTSLRWLIDTSEESSPVRKIALQAGLMNDPDSDTNGERLETKKLPVPGDFQPDQPDVRGPGSPQGLFSAMDEADDDQFEPQPDPQRALGDEKTEPRFHPQQQESNRRVTIEVPTLSGRLLELATVVEGIEEASTIQITTRRREQFLGELMVYNGSVGPLMKVGASVVVDDAFCPGGEKWSNIGPDTGLEQFWQQIIRRESRQQGSTQWPEVVGAGIREMLSGLGDDVPVIEIIPMSQFDGEQMDSQVGAVTLLQAAMRHRSEKLSPVARRVYQIASRHQAGRWMFAVDPQEGNSPVWLPVRHAATPPVSAKAVGQLGSRLAEIAATSAQLDISPTDTGRLVTLYGDDSQRLFAFGTTGGCLIDIEPHLLGAVFGTARQAIVDQRSDTPESERQ